MDFPRALGDTHWDNSALQWFSFDSWNLPATPLLKPVCHTLHPCTRGCGFPGISITQGWKNETNCSISTFAFCSSASLSQIWGSGGWRHSGLCSHFRTIQFWCRHTWSPSSRCPAGSSHIRSNYEIGVSWHGSEWNPPDVSHWGADWENLQERRGDKWSDHSQRSRGHNPTPRPAPWPRLLAQPRRVQARKVQKAQWKGRNITLLFFQ